MRLTSVFPPMPTPFRDGEVDASAIRFNVERWMRAGLGGIVALGTNGESALLEIELRNAIARGRGWLATEKDLREIESLCSSGWCKGETNADLREWEGTLSIDLRDGLYRVAQYSGLENVAAVEAKLAQFPRGTKFVMHGSGAQADAIRRFAAVQGLMIE